MDAARLLGVIRPILAGSGTRWALAGGFAIAAWGSTRATADLDLLVEETARKDVLAALESVGFETFNDAEGFSNLQHKEPSLGRLDLIWLAGETARKIFGAAVERLGSDGLPLLVPRPEHLVAMKVRAIQSRATRVLRDGPDIAHLLGLPGIDQNQARGYFERAGLGELYERLKPPAGR